VVGSPDADRECVTGTAPLTALVEEDGTRALGGEGLAPVPGDRASADVLLGEPALSLDRDGEPARRKGGEVARIA
jgi:hypothetical protein